jgi:uncharacterized membrane protein
MAWTDDEIDRRMGRLLKSGVLIAAGFMLAGGIVYLSTRLDAQVDYSHFHPGNAEIRNILQIFHQASHGNAAALIQVGTLLMIATPVARVAFAIYAFLRSHDRMYVIVSSIVLLLLAYGIFFGS